MEGNVVKYCSQISLSLGVDNSVYNDENFNPEHVRKYGYLLYTDKDLNILRENVNKYMEKYLKVILDQCNYPFTIMRQNYQHIVESITVTVVGKNENKSLSSWNDLMLVFDVETGEDFELDDFKYIPVRLNHVIMDFCTNEDLLKSKGIKKETIVPMLPDNCEYYWSYKFQRIV